MYSRDKKALIKATYVADLSRIRYLINCTKKERGRVAEGKVALACRSLLERGVIMAFGMSQPNDANDRRGRDGFIVLSNSSAQVWFQVKSSRYGVFKHKLESVDKIPVIKIEPGISIEAIEGLLIRKFNLGS